MSEIKVAFADAHCAAYFFLGAGFYNSSTLICIAINIIIKAVILENEGYI